MDFIYSPPVLRPNPYRKGDNCFNRYTHKSFHITMQHYVDDDRFVIQYNNHYGHIWFNGICNGEIQLISAIQDGSVYSLGDTVQDKNTGIVGFMYYRLALRNARGDHRHCISYYKKRKIYFSAYAYESNLMSKKTMLTEKCIK